MNKQKSIKKEFLNQGNKMLYKKLLIQGCDIESMLFPIFVHLQLIEHNLWFEIKKNKFVP